MQDAYQLDENRIGFCRKPRSALTFRDGSFSGRLMTGARLVVARPGGHQDSAYLVELIEGQEITTLHFVPSMLQIFLEEKGLDRCSCLRRVICSGEALPFDLQERFFASSWGQNCTISMVRRKRR